VLYNGLGRYEEALEAGVRAVAESQEMWFARWGLVDLIEAAARSGDINLARDAVERLARQRVRGRDRLGSRHRGSLAGVGEHR